MHESRRAGLARENIAHDVMWSMARCIRSF